MGHTLAAILRRSSVGEEDAEAYLADFVHKAGAPADLLAQRMLMHLAVADCSLAQLRADMADAPTPEHVKMLGTLTARETHEFFRSALAYQKYSTHLAASESTGNGKQGQRSGGDGGRQPAGGSAAWRRGR